MNTEKKILVFTVASWNSKVGANTWASLLDDYPSDKIANLCIREEFPDSNVCARYFVIHYNIPASQKALWFCVYVFYLAFYSLKAAYPLSHLFSGARAGSASRRERCCDIC